MLAFSHMRARTHAHTHAHTHTHTHTHTPGASTRHHAWSPDALVSRASDKITKYKKNKLKKPMLAFRASLSRTVQKKKILMSKHPIVFAKESSIKCAFEQVSKET